MIYEIKNKKPLKNKFKLHKYIKPQIRLVELENLKKHRNFSKKY